MPRKPTESEVSVVAVLLERGKGECAVRAAAAEVPLIGSSLRPFMIVSATALLTTCSHGGVLIWTGLPVWSTTLAIGLGSHHTPPLARVAPTLASSSGLSGLTPRVNDGWLRNDWLCGLVV